MDNLLKGINTNTANSTLATIGNNTQPVVQNTQVLTPQTSTVDIPKTIPSDTLSYKAPTGTTIEAPINATTKSVDALSNAVMTTPVVVPTVTPPTDRELAIQDRQKAIDLYTNPETGYSATANTLANENGLVDKTAQLNALNVKDLALQKQLKDYQDTVLNKNPQGLFGGAGQQAISQYERDISSQRADLAIQKLALQGDISTAQTLIKNKLDAQFEPIKNRIDYLDKTISIYGNDLTESQKAKLELEKYQLQEQNKDKDTFQKIIDEAGIKGAPVDIQNQASNLYLKGDRASAIKLLAPYSVKATVESLTPYQKFQATESIAKETEVRTSKAQEIVRQSNVMNTALKNLQAGGNKSVATQAIIATFNKILDPTSTVREGEYDRTAQGQSLVQQIEGKLGNIVNGGGGVTDATLADAVALSNEYLKGAKDSIAQQNQRAIDFANQFGLNSDLVTSTKYEGNPEIKELNGVKYKKVQGGWEQVSFNDVGGDTNQASIIEKAKVTIAGNETGGRKDPYGTVSDKPTIRAGGRKDYAYGKYQVMGDNIPSWTKEALGTPMTIEEFKNNPDAQEKVFEYKFAQHLKKYGSLADATSAWFTGGPLKGNEKKKDANGTTNAQYVSNALKTFNS